MRQCPENMYVHTPLRHRDKLRYRRRIAWRAARRRNRSLSSWLRDECRPCWIYTHNFVANRLCYEYVFMLPLDFNPDALPESYRPGDLIRLLLTNEFPEVEAYRPVDMYMAVPDHLQDFQGP